MMLFKLALKNITKSVKDYAVYFATLALGVAVFYVFNALDSQTVMLKITNDTRDIVDLIIEVMSIVSIFVSFVLGFLIVYASSFLMKRRKKEFGVYLLLGMGKAKVSTILCVETLMVGIVSLFAGLGLGIIASQGMSIVIANLFDADLTRFRFTVSTNAIVKTMVYFIVIFAVVIIFQTLVVGKNRLINLIHADKKPQKNYGKNSVVCLIVFAIGAVLLGTAYYRVTVKFTDITSLIGIGKEILKGIIGNFAVFWSMSGILILLIKSSKKIYYRGLTAFTTKELSSRVNTSVFAGGIISLLLFFTICILSCSVTVKNSMDAIIDKKVAADIQFSVSKTVDEDYGVNLETVSEIMEENGVDDSFLKDVTNIQMFYDSSVNMKTLTTEDIYKLYYSPDAVWIPMITISDYNCVADIYGMPEYELGSNQYIIVADYEQVMSFYDDALEGGQDITVNGKTYYPAYSECKDGFVLMSASLDNSGVLILPDDTDFSFANYADSIMTANYDTDDDEQYEEIERYFNNEEVELLLNSGNRDHGYVNCETRKTLCNDSVGFTVLLIFVGLYLGIIFLISSGAILSLKELSEAADSREKYRILRKIGVDEKQIRHSLRTQCGLFFGLPLTLAIIHSIFGIQTGLLILAVFGRGDLLGSIIVSALIIIGIYGIYFAITYSCSKKIISESF